MTTTPSHECPYQGLKPYTEAEREYFFGRESIQEVIASNLRIAPLTVLYGGSGVGKSSVLQAGVIPLLEEDPRIIVVLFNQWQGAFSSTLSTKVLKAVCENTGASQEEALQKIGGALKIEVSSPDSLPLDRLLIGSADAFHRRILLIFDQFEEYFLYHATSTKAEGFEAEFARAVHHHDSGVHFMISMREEQLSKLDRFRARIPNLLTNLLRLDNLNREEATSAIKSPLLVYNRKYPDTPMDIEPALLDVIIHEVRLKAATNEGGAVQTVEASNAPDSSVRIDTPFLQLVLTRLWQAEKDQGSNMLRLKTFKDLGGAETIAGMHFDSVMGKLEGQHRQTAAAVLSFLVTPTGSKIAQQPATLAKWGKVSETEVENALTLLSSQQDMRILRKISLAGHPDLYELSHDVLGRPILKWLNSYEIEQAQITAHKELEQEQARGRRRSKLLVAMALLAIGMGALALYAYSQKKEANRSQLNARAQQLAGGAWVEMSRDPELSYLLALEAVETLPNADTDQLQREVAQFLLESRLRTVIRGHDGPIIGATYSSDGQRILTLGSSDKRIRVLDGAGRNLISEILLTESGYSARISPDGKLVVTSTPYGSVRLWSADTGQLVRELKEQLPGINLTVFSADSRLLATASEGGGGRVWELNTGREILLPGGPSTGVWTSALSFSADGRRLVVVNSNGRVTIWDWAAGKVISEWPGRNESIWAVAFSPDHQQVFIADVDQDWFVLDLKTGRRIAQMKAQRGAPQSGAFSSDGKYIVTTSRNNSVGAVWEVATGKLLYELVGHTDRVNSAEFSPNGRFIVTAGSDETARVWDLWTGKTVAELRGHKDEVYEAKFGPDGKFVLTASADGSARIWEPFGEGELLLGHRGNVLQGSFSSDGQLAITASSDSSAKLWDINKSQVIADFSGEHLTGLYGAALSPDGHLVATASGDESARLWDRTTRNPLVKLIGHYYEIVSIAFSPDSKLVLTGSNDSTAKLWSTSGELVHTFTGHEAGVVAQFSHDGKKIVTGSADNTARIWDVATKELLHTLEGANGHKGIITSAFFSHDDRYVVTGSRDRTARIWDVATGAMVRELVGHKNAVYYAQFSHDNRLVLTTSSDHTLQVWEAATGKNLAILRRHVGLIFSGAFSPDGKRLISTGEDNTARVYSCDICGPTSDVVRMVNERIHGLRTYYTEEEKRKYAVE